MDFFLFWLTLSGELKNVEQMNMATISQLYLCQSSAFYKKKE